MARARGYVKLRDVMKARCHILYRFDFIVQVNNNITSFRACEDGHSGSWSCCSSAPAAVARFRPVLPVVAVVVDGAAGVGC